METATPDISTQIYQAIWTALNADTAWLEAVPVSNQVRFDNLNGTIQNPVNVPVDDADYPRATLFWPTNGTNDLFMTDQTFATWGPGGPSQWSEQLTRTYKLVIVSQLHSAQESDSLAEETVNAFRRAGPRLNVPWITGVKLRYQTKETTDSPSDSDSSAQVRTETIFGIYISAEIDGTEFTGGN